MRLALTNAAEAAPAALRRSLASSASLVGAVGIQRMGGEDAHADEGEDTC